MSDLDLVNRLRGIYKIGPDGEYGKRDFSEFVPAISLEAADEIERLGLAIIEKDREINALKEIIAAYYIELHKFENWIGDNESTDVSIAATKAMNRVIAIAEALS